MSDSRPETTRDGSDLRHVFLPSKLLLLTRQDSVRDTLGMWSLSFLAFFFPSFLLALSCQIRTVRDLAIPSWLHPIENCCVDGRLVHMNFGCQVSLAERNAVRSTVQPNESALFPATRSFRRRAETITAYARQFCLGGSVMPVQHPSL